MNILCIETSHEFGSVSLITKSDIYTQEYTEKTYSHAEKINLLIDQCLRLAHITLNDLDSIAVNGGPGSYTGLRIGVSTAKALCYSLSIPLVSLDSFQIMHQATIANKHPSVVSYHTRAHEMMIQAYDLEGNNSPVQHINLNENQQLPYTERLWIGSGVDKLLSHLNLHQTPNIRPHARLMTSLAKEYTLSRHFEDYRTFEPNYMKKVHISKKK